MIVYERQMPNEQLDLNDSAQRMAVLSDLLRYLDLAAPTEQGAAARPLRLELDEPAVQGYAQACCDMLALLGALRWDGGTFEIASPLAGCLLRLLRAGLSAPALLALDWSAEGVGAVAELRGVDLLAVLERRRLALLPDAEPLRETEAALGLILRAGPGGEREALLVWDAPAGAWQLIGGRRELRDASLRATLLRELAEELGCAPLAEGADARLRELGTPFAIARLSPTTGMLTRTQFQLFGVELLAELPPLPVEARWLRESELLAGQTDDGLPVAAEPLLRLRDALGLDLERALGL